MSKNKPTKTKTIISRSEAANVDCLKMEGRLTIASRKTFESFGGGSIYKTNAERLKRQGEIFNHSGECGKIITK